MRAIPILLASVEVDDVLAQWQSLSASTKERLIILSAMVLITLPVVVWAVFFRKARRRQHEHHHSRHHSPEPANPTAAEDGDGDPERPRKRRKWRRPRREHRPRNPTLAETGGLPPVRTGEPPEIRP